VASVPEPVFRAHVATVAAPFHRRGGAAVILSHHSEEHAETLGVGVALTDGELLTARNCGTVGSSSRSRTRSTAELTELGLPLAMVLASGKAHRALVLLSPPPFTMSW
jgi:hypothetical protein